LQLPREERKITRGKCGCERGGGGDGRAGVTLRAQAQALSSLQNKGDALVAFDGTAWGVVATTR
jgi:hypothetical protein